MANLNEVRLIGRLTCEVKGKQVNGLQICDFGIAINRKYKAQDGQQREETTFVDITAFGNLAQNTEKYLHKGSQIFIAGRLRFDTWEDKQNKQKRSKLSVIAENIQFLDSAPKHQENQPIAQTTQFEYDDDLPF